MSAPLPPLRVLMLSYGVTEESGGPGVAADGFARGLAKLGVDVRLLALEAATGRWLVDPASARRDGFHYRRVSGRFLLPRTFRMMRELAALRQESRSRTVVWVNAIWDAQSLAAGLWSLIEPRWPIVIRPAGSLGRSALGYKYWKKATYLHAVEAPVLRRAAAIHCMSEKERNELPDWLRDRAFIVPSGVHLEPSSPAAARTGHDRARIVGVLARLHPIKNHPAALSAVEDLVRRGLDLHVEFAGTTRDQAYEARLRRQADTSPLLRGRVRFLGHVERSQVADVVGRWSMALLLSEQENFGHAVIAAAAAGVPTVVSTGVGLGPAIERAGAGAVVEASEASEAILRLWRRDEAEVARACLDFAQQYSWDACSQALLRHLEALVN